MLEAPLSQSSSCCRGPCVLLLTPESAPSTAPTKQRGERSGDAWHTTRRTGALLRPPERRDRSPVDRRFAHTCMSSHVLSLVRHALFRRKTSSSDEIRVRRLFLQLGTIMQSPVDYGAVPDDVESRTSALAMSEPGRTPRRPSDDTSPKSHRPLPRRPPAGRPPRCRSWPPPAGGVADAPHLPGEGALAIHRNHLPSHAHATYNSTRPDASRRSVTHTW